MLSFEVVNEGKTIQVYCDSAGLRMLIDILKKAQGEDTSHIHLRAPSCGGIELNEENPWGIKAITEVIITTGGD